MSGLAGTWPLVRLALRLDRARLAAWVGALLLVVVATAIGFGELYPDAASRRQLAAGIGSNPALLAMYGRLEAQSVGGLTVWRQGAFQLVLVALMSLLTVVRHTRAAEETGRIELVGAAAIGRRAPLAAALGTASLGSTAIGLTVAVGMVAVGQDAAGSIAFGAALAATGWAFAGVAAVTAQLTDDARTARALAGAVLAAAFALRAAGDAAAGGALAWLTWASPLGWAHSVRPYADERWWALTLPVLLVAAMVTVADRLLARRDLGSGLLTARPGTARAAGYLSHPLGLAWRLQRTTFFWWVAIMLSLGAVFGGLVGAITQLFETTPQLAAILQRLGGQGRVVDAYLGAIMSVLALLVSAYAVGATLELRAEETALHTEHILATAVTRCWWAAGHLLFAFAAPAILLLAGGAAAGLASGLVMGAGASDVGRTAVAALAQLPAVWVVAGITVAVVGLLPRWTALAYGALATFLVLGQVGEALQLDQAMLNLSPFVHVPALPHSAMRWTPLLWLTAVAGGLVAAGMTGLRHRDLAP